MKSVVNITLDDNVIKHNHPEVTDISGDYVSISVDQTITSNKVFDGNVTLSNLSGSVVVSNTSGVLQDSNVTITDGLSGGSVINVQEFTTDPLSSDLLPGDLYMLDSPATSGKILKYFDGANKYSIELGKE